MSDADKQGNLGANPQAEIMEENDKTLGMTYERSTDLMLGQLVAQKYKVLGELGRGGMGVVYRVEQVALGRIQAMKTLNTHEVSDVTWRRFQVEAKAAAMLDHPNLISVHDCGLINNEVPFFIMDYIEGTTLAKLLKSKGALSLEETLTIFIQVCFGLAYAHAVGVIHRDLKPSNIMLVPPQSDSSGLNVKVVDFGIAKLTDEELQPTQALTRTGEIFGSPLYMSPEQCLGKPVDHRSDIYSLGCVIFECLAGVPPFLGNTALSTMMQHQSSDAPSLKEATLGKDFPAEVENILQLMLKKDPAERYQSMSVVARELSLVQQGLFNLVQVPRDSTAKQEKGANYSPILYSLLACLVSGLLSSAAVYYSMNLRLQSAFDEGFRKGGESERNKLPPISNEKAFGSDDSRISKENSTPDKVAPDRKYSRIIKDNDGSLKRVFDFPLAATFGSLYLMDKDKRIKTKDINRRKFGLNEPFQLDVESADIAADPNFFLHFNNNELTGVRFRFNDGVRDETFTFIDNQKSLKLLDLKSCKVTSRILDKLNSLPELTFLSVTRTGLTGKDLLKLKRLKKLTTLSMAHLPGQSKVLADIKGSPLLDTLEISAKNLSEADFKCLSSFKYLRRLWIKDAGTITDKDLAWLGNLRGLQEFYLEPALSTAQIDKITQRLTRLNTIWVNPEVWSKNDIDRYQSKYPRIKILHDQSPPRL